MLRRRRCLAAAVTLAGILGAPAAARAATPDGEAREYNPLVLNVDLAAAVTAKRYGVQIEWVFDEKDSLVANPWHLESASRGTADLFLGDTDGMSVYATQSRANGLDAQYRRYFGGRGGAEGFFLAPGFEVQHFMTSTVTTVSSGFEVTTIAPPVREEWTYAGPSFDLGGQFIARLGFVLGGSVGFHYRVALGGLNDSHYAWEWGAANGPGLRPRMRFWLGWAF